MLSNYPPGVTEDMIPGNGPFDVWMDKVYEQLDDDIYGDGDFTEMEEDNIGMWAADMRAEGFSSAYTAKMISAFLRERRNEEKDFT